MWSDVIRQTGLTSPAANWFFDKEGKKIFISDDRNEADSSLLTTLRYLLFDKLNGETARFYAMTPGDSLRNTNINSRIRRFYANGSPETDSYVMVINTYSSPDEMQGEFATKFGFTADAGTMLADDSAIVQEFEYNSEVVTLNLKYQKSLTYFFGNKFGVYAFSDMEKHFTVVFTSRENRQKYHWLQAVFPMLMPWYWADEEGKVTIEPEKLPLLEALNSTDVNAYLEIVEGFANSLNIESDYADSRLADFLNVSRNRALESTSREVSNIRDRIDEYLRYIGEYRAQLSEKLAYLRGLELDADNTNAEDFAAYIKNNKAVRIVEFGSSTMRIVVDGFFEYYDTDPLEEYLASPGSMVYRRTSGTNLEGDKIKKLLKAIFIDEVLRVRVCSAFTVDVDSNRIRALQDYSYPTEYRKHYPNPHIQHYACIGDYSQSMAEYLASGNFIGAVEQCIASNQTMNFYDSAVTSALVSDLVNIYDSVECVMLPDGTFTTAKKALEYLDAHAE